MQFRIEHGYSINNDIGAEFKLTTWGRKCSITFTKVAPELLPYIGGTRTIAEISLRAIIFSLFMFNILPQHCCISPYVYSLRLFSLDSMVFPLARWNCLQCIHLCNLTYILKWWQRKKWLSAIVHWAHLGSNFDTLDLRASANFSGGSFLDFQCYFTSMNNGTCVGGVFLKLSNSHHCRTISTSKCHLGGPRETSCCPLFTPTTKLFKSCTLRRFQHPAFQQ